MHKEIRKAIAEAEKAGLNVQPLTGRSAHTWGWIICDPCGDHVQVFSTGRAPETGAKKIRAFIRKHAPHVKKG